MLIKYKYKSNVNVINALDLKNVDNTTGAQHKYDRFISSSIYLSLFFCNKISVKWFTFIFSQKSPGNFNIRPDLSSLLLCVNHSSHCQTTTRDVFRIQSYFHPGSFQRLTLILHLSGHASSVQQQYIGGGHINSLSLKYDVTLIF